MLNRRTLLAGAAGAAVVAPVVAESEPLVQFVPLPPREQALWHMRELERLLIEDGAQGAMITIVGLSYPEKYSKAMITHTDMDLWDVQGLFA